MKRKLFSLLAMFFGMLLMWLGFVGLCLMVQSNTTYLVVGMGPIVIGLMMLFALFESIKD